MLILEINILDEIESRGREWSMKREEEKISSFLEDEESRFIFENRLLHNEYNDYLYIQKIVDRCIPESFLQKQAQIEDGLLEILRNKKNIWIWGGGGCRLHEIFAGNRYENRTRRSKRNY